MSFLRQRQCAAAALRGAFDASAAGAASPGKRGGWLSARPFAGWAAGVMCDRMGCHATAMPPQTERPGQEARAAGRTCPRPMGGAFNPILCADLPGLMGGGSRGSPAPPDVSPDGSRDL